MAKSPQSGILNGKVSWLHAWRLQNGSCPQNPFPTVHGDWMGIECSSAFSWTIFGFIRGCVVVI